MVKEIDEQGRINLSIKRLDPNYKDLPGGNFERRPRPPRGNGNFRNGGHGNNDRPQKKRFWEK
jgi:hypothetical protein